MRRSAVGSLTRRRVLAGLSAVAAAPAFAFGDSSRFVPALLQHGSGWDKRASGLRRLAWELERRTSVEVVLDSRPLAPSSSRLFEHPFLYLSGDSELPAFKPDEVENLRRYLTFGGFLFVDSSDSAFDTSARRELARVLPQSPLGVLPSSHVVFKSFYLLESAPGRVLNQPHLEAALMGRRAAVMYSQNDVLGALNRDESGAWEFEITPGGERQREIATRVAVNVAMYALCLDYKDDAVHLPLIMKRRK